MTLSIHISMTLRAKEKRKHCATHEKLERYSNNSTTDRPQSISISGTSVFNPHKRRLVDVGTKLCSKSTLPLHGTISQCRQTSFQRQFACRKRNTTREQQRERQWCFMLDGFRHYLSNHFHRECDEAYRTQQRERQTASNNTFKIKCKKIKFIERGDTLSIASKWNLKVRARASDPIPEFCAHVRTYWTSMYVIGWYVSSDCLCVCVVCVCN